MAIIRFDPESHADPEFIHSYGEALLQWSYIENRLFRWFEALTGMPDDMARAVFFSARSFLGRSEMLRAVIPHAKFPRDTGPLAREIVEGCLAKANDYSKLRNMLAHGFPIREFSEKGKRELLVQGKHSPPIQFQQGLTTETFKIVAKNFAALAGITNSARVHYFRGHHLPGYEQQLKLLLDRLTLLPNEPASEQPSGKQVRQAAQKRKSPKS